MAFFAWTEERIEMASSLWQQGKSGSEIAAILGDGITRYAVIGKINRLGIAARAVGKKQPKKGEPPKKVAKPQKHIVERIIARDDESSFERASVGGVGFMDRTHSQCAWPHGDTRDLSSFRFCGAETAREGAPYCAGHMALAYVPTSRRVDMRPVRNATSIRGWVE
jgi:GcrA cell cycle regulator